MTMILAWDNPEERVNHDHHHQSTPNALPAHNFQSRQVGVFHEILLCNDLARLKKLSRHDKGHAEYKFFDSSLIFTPQVNRMFTVTENIREANDAKAK
mmetsp:Transcript_100056/g.188352  ORF Transcript_100056/g.188352 Transcript_100056/m.188352 type:complete len:98 (-) Transcript_100056:584-877(-)